MKMKENPVKLSQELSKLCYDLGKRISDDKQMDFREGSWSEKPRHTGAFRFAIWHDGVVMYGFNASRLLWELWQLGIKNRDDLRYLGHVIEKKAFGKTVGEFMPELESFFDPYAEPKSRIFGVESVIRN
jgi:hypothetical protein